MQNLISVLETTKSYLDSFNTYYPLPFWVFSLAKLMKPLAIQLMPATTPENFNCFFRDKDPQYVRDIYCFVTCLKLSICVCYWHLHYQVIKKKSFFCVFIYYFFTFI